jgi:hypothetical protein
MERDIEARISRRHRVPALPDPPANPATARNWLIYFGILVGLLLLMTEGGLDHAPSHAPLPQLSEATDVISTVAATPADSLEVVVAWELTLSDPAGRPDSVRVRVIGQQGDTVTATQPADQLADTVYLPVPAPGQTVGGRSCVSARHPAQPISEECTPWQYVRPAATPMAAAQAPSAVTPTSVVVKPSGLQVDPDVNGRCAEWQRTHPRESVWLSVNRKAVPACTGPNQKPTVAQFCAFAVLPGGKKVKTQNSSNNRYCDELFEVWARERIS